MTSTEMKRSYASVVASTIPPLAKKQVLGPIVHQSVASPATALPPTSTPATLPQPTEQKPIHVQPPGTIDLFVPFEQKDEVRDAGAIWNPDDRIWYCFPPADDQDSATIAMIEKFRGVHLLIPKEEQAEAKERYNVRYRPVSRFWWGAAGSEAEARWGVVWFTKRINRDLAKNYGFRWSPFFRLWYTNKSFAANMDQAVIQKFL